MCYVLLFVMLQTLLLSADLEDDLLNTGASSTVSGILVLDAL